MERPACLVGSLTLALLWIEAIMPQGVFWLPAAFSILAGGVWWLFHHRLTGVCWAAAGVLSVLLCWTAPDGPACLQPEQTVQIQAVVQESSYRHSLLLVQQVNDKATRFYATAKGLPRLEPGTRLAAHVTMHSLDEPSHVQQRAKGVYWQVQAHSGTVQTMGFYPPGAMQQLRTRMAYHLRHGLTPEIGGVLCAMLLGQREAIPKPLYRAYQSAGIPHVLVVSGLHLAVLCSLLHKDLTTEKKALRYAMGCILIVILFVPMAGAESSLLRAGMAVLFSSVAIWIGGHSDPFTSLALSGVLLSIGRPALVWSLSFQLSVCATAGILLGAACVRKLPPPPGGKWTRALWGDLRQQVILSLLATLFVMPVQALWGLPVRLIGVASNLIVFLLLKPILVGGLIAALTGGIPLLDPIYHLARLVSSGLVGLLNQITEAMAGFGAVPLAENRLWVGCCAVLLIICLVVRMHWEQQDP